MSKRIRNGVESKLRKEQARFRLGRGTTEQITFFVLKNIIEKSIEWHFVLYVNFPDFEKAFDSIHRDSLWLIMQSYGIASKMISGVKAHYNDFECTVVNEEDTTERLKIRKGEITLQTRSHCTCFLCPSYKVWKQFSASRGSAGYGLHKIISTAKIKWA